METLTIAADFGASLGKAIYNDGSKQPKLILLKPEIISLPQSSITAYQNSLRLGSSYPEDTAWLRVNDRFYALGELAKHRFRVVSHLDEPKYSKAIYQCLAIIGSVLQREKSHPDQINLSILLPFNEFKYQSEFSAELRLALANFTFRGLDYSLKLNSFTCLPEGSGLYLRGRKVSLNGELLSSPRNITLAVIMMGYRNVSLMVIDRGAIKVKETTMQGFAQMLNLIKERVSVLEEEALISAMSKPNASQRRKALHRLAVSNNQEIRQQQVDNLEWAIKHASQEYLTIVQDFLSVNLQPFELDEFVVGGGTAHHFRKQMQKYLSSFSENISWGDSLERRIERFFGPLVRTQSLPSRLCDVYGLLYFSLGKPLPTVLEVAK